MVVYQHIRVTDWLGNVYEYRLLPDGRLQVRYLVKSAAGRSYRVPSPRWRDLKVTNPNWTWERWVEGMRTRISYDGSCLCYRVEAVVPQGRGKPAKLIPLQDDLPPELKRVPEPLICEAAP